MNIPKIEEAITLLYQTYIEDQDVATQRGIAITAMNEMVKLLGGDDVVAKVEVVPYSARVRAHHLFEDAPQRKPLTLGQKQKLWSSVGHKPTLKDRVNAYGFAIEAAHGIGEKK